jgi:hypothetical protein
MHAMTLMTYIPSGTITRDTIMSSPTSTTGDIVISSSTSTGVSCVNLYVFIGVVVGVTVLAAVIISLISIIFCVTCVRKNKVTVELYEQETKKSATLKMDEF